MKLASYLNTLRRHSSGACFHKWNYTDRQTGITGRDEGVWGWGWNEKQELLSCSSLQFWTPRVTEPIPANGLRPRTAFVTGMVLVIHASIKSSASRNHLCPFTVALNITSNRKVEILSHVKVLKSMCCRSFQYDGWISSSSRFLGTSILNGNTLILPTSMWDTEERSLWFPILALPVAPSVALEVTGAPYPFPCL